MRISPGSPPEYV